MECLGLDDSFAEAFGEAIAKNSTIKRVSLSNNAITGTGMKALFAGLGKNSSIEEFHVRHQIEAMSSADEEALLELLADNNTIIKVGVDISNKMVKMKLGKITFSNRDQRRKLRSVNTAPV